MIEFLPNFKNVFAWSYEDMPGLAMDVVMHRLPLTPDYKSVNQKLRRMKPQWVVKVKEEVVK